MLVLVVLLAGATLKHLHLGFIMRALRGSLLLDFIGHVFELDEGIVRSAKLRLQFLVSDEQALSFFVHS